MCHVRLAISLFEFDDEPHSFKNEWFATLISMKLIFDKWAMEYPFNCSEFFLLIVSEQLYLVSLDGILQLFKIHASRDQVGNLNIDKLPN